MNSMLAQIITNLDMATLQRLQEQVASSNLRGWIEFLSSIVVAVGTLLLALRKIDKIKVTPQPLEVISGFRAVSKEEFEKHVAFDLQEHRDLFAKIGGSERGGIARMESITAEWRRFVDAKLGEILGHGDDGREKLWNAVNAVDRRLAKLEGVTEQQNQTLAQINAKIDRVAEKR